MTPQQNTAPIQGRVVGQFYTLYDGVTKEDYGKVVAAAPFDKCNLLVLAFIRTFEFVRDKDSGGNIWVAQFANGRVDGNGNPYPLDPNDTDGDRVAFVVETARKKNPSINIVVSLGWGANDTGNAASSPIAFADSLRALVQAYDLDGIDIDYESTSVAPAAMLALAQEIRRSLNKIPSKRPKIMTITPARDDDREEGNAGLNKSVLDIFDYVMPQTYAHGGNGTIADWYAEQLGSYTRIVFGLDSEPPADDPTGFAGQVNSNHAAGLFAWRLNGDAFDQHSFPDFKTAIAMWKLMHPAGEEAAVA